MLQLGKHIPAGHCGACWVDGAQDLVSRVEMDQLERRAESGLVKLSVNLPLVNSHGSVVEAGEFSGAPRESTPERLSKDALARVAADEPEGLDAQHPGPVERSTMSNQRVKIGRQVQQRLVLVVNLDNLERHCTYAQGAERRRGNVPPTEAALIPSIVES